jgi:leucine-rich repeat protein SHOC2
LNLYNNQLTSLPAEIGQLTSLTELWLSLNQLTSLPAAIRELRAAGCDVWLDDGVTFDE